MVLRKKFAVVLLTIFIGVFSTHLLFGELGVKLVEKIETLPRDYLPTTLWSFCVTEDEVFIVPDYDEGVIKIYVKNEDSLELVNSIGQKGFREGDLGNPAYCFYDKSQLKFGVIDYGLRKIFIYDRIGRVDFKRVREVRCLRLATAVKLKNDKLLIAGFEFNKKNQPFELYSVDITNNKMNFLLSPVEKYGLKSLSDFYKGLKNIIVIGVNSWFDIQDGSIFFNWEGNYEIIKIDIESGKILNRFEKRPPLNYTPPEASDELRKAHKDLDLGKTEQERAKYTYVTNIFATSIGVFVIFEGPGKSNFRMKHYTLDGRFIKEAAMPMPGLTDIRMYLLEKEQKELYLYSLSKLDDNEGDYSILKKHKIIQE